MFDPRTPAERRRDHREASLSKARLRSRYDRLLARADAAGIDRPDLRALRDAV